MVVVFWCLRRLVAVIVSGMHEIGLGLVAVAICLCLLFVVWV